MLRRFFSYYARYKTLFFLDFGCAVLAGLLELGFHLAIKLFVDQLLPSHNWGLIALVTVALLAVYLINTGLMAVVNYWGHALGISIETDMRRQAFDHIQKLSFRFFDNNNNIFDNSKNNPHNPDPTVSVRWGEQTYDEMMVGFFDVAVDPSFDKKRFFQTNAVPEMPTYSGIGVVYDPGIPVVLMGMYTIILGTALAFLVRPIAAAYGKRAGTEAA